MSEKSSHTVFGSEMIVREVVKSGNGAIVYVPKGWTGEKITIIRTEK